MNNGKVRIYELSKELNLDNREILAVCDQLDISVKSHSSTITGAEAVRIRSAADRRLSGSAPVKPVPPFASSVAKPISSEPVRTRQPVKKQQILEMRKNRPPTDPPRTLTGPPRRREGNLEAEAQQTLQRSSLRRATRSGKGYIEPLLDVDSALPLHMVLISDGTFLMGSPDGEIGRSDSEDPQYSVTLSRFFIGRYPVTQAQWRVVATMPQVENQLDPDPSKFKGNNHPVGHISWHDAVEFCARLKKHTNRPYRLPSESEWEYACRAGTTESFYFGRDLTYEIANYTTPSKLSQVTTPVNHDIANAFGLSDMHGNVREWCQDNWHDNYVGAPTDGSAWLNQNDATKRILRGGSYRDDPRDCRSASRSSYPPINRSNSVGFRVVCSAP